MKIRHIEIKNFRGIKSLSWHVKGDFNCIIGAGDTCKTTILIALDYALSPRSSVSFDDSDFYDQNVNEAIAIQVTLTDWDGNNPEIRKFLSENKFGQYKCGIDNTGPVAEPNPNSQAISVSLRVDKDLEPKWAVVRGREEGQGNEKVIYASDRAVLGVSKLDISSDSHFTWGRNTILTRLSSNSQDGLGAIISELARVARQQDISTHSSIAECLTVAQAIQREAIGIGVKLANLSPKIDVQKQSMNAGAVSLHENNIPLRNMGSGSKKLISFAMQMKLHDGKNVSLIDEIETGLEPHRIRGLIYRLKNSGQQIFATTHSPVVIRELDVVSNELYVCRKGTDGVVYVESLNSVPNVQGAVRTNAEAFLGSKIIMCEGATEIGCLRAYDRFRFDRSNPPVWSLAIAYFNCNGAGEIKPKAPLVAALGYKTAIFCDNDAPEHLSAQDVADFISKAIPVFQWEASNSTENQLIKDLPWEHIPTLLAKMCECHLTLELATVIDIIRKNPAVSGQNLSTDIATWQDTSALRKVIGDAIKKGEWIKRIVYAERVFEFALPLLPESTITKTKLKEIWDWIQND